MVSSGEGALDSSNEPDAELGQSDQPAPLSSDQAVSEYLGNSPRFAPFTPPTFSFPDDPFDLEDAALLGFKLPLDWNGRSFDLLLKIVLCGDSYVGKSCILLQWTDKRSHPVHDLSIGVEFSARTIGFPGGVEVKIQAWDTAGQKSFRSITRSYYRGAAAILLCADVTCRDSVEHIPEWLEDIRRHAHPSCSIFLVANKIDLANRFSDETREALVRCATDQGLPLLFVSARTGDGIDDAFATVTTMTVQKLFRVLGPFGNERLRDLAMMMESGSFRMSRARNSLGVLIRDECCRRREASAFLTQKALSFRMSGRRSMLSIPLDSIENAFASKEKSLCLISYSARTGFLRSKRVVSTVMIASRGERDEERNVDHFESFLFQLSIFIRERFVEVNRVPKQSASAFRFLHRGIRGDEEVFEEVLSTIENQERLNLKRLEFRNVPLGTELFPLVMECVSWMAITVLDLRGCCLTADSMTALCRCMPRELTELILQQNPDITFVGALTLSEHISLASTPLVSLNLRRTGIGPQGIQALSRALARLSGGRVFDLLDFSDIDLTEAAVKDLGRLVLSGAVRCLKLLHLSNENDSHLIFQLRLAVGESQEIEISDEILTPLTEDEKADAIMAAEEEANRRIEEEAAESSVDDTSERHILSREQVSIGKNRIGRGASGIVKTGVVHIGLQDFEVAIKMGLSGQRPRSDVEAEVMVMAQLQHENVLRCFGCWFAADLWYIALELCDSDLLAWLRRHRRNGTLTTELKLSALLGMAKGLRYLHSMGITHRDVKPDNVLIKGNIMKLCDFGVSKRLESAQLSLVGTAGYLPRWIGEDKRSLDVYAYGIVSWEVWMAGERAYMPERRRFLEPMELIAFVHVNELRPPIEECEDMPKEVGDLICRCWAEDPAARPQFVEIVRVLESLDARPVTVEE